ncbi:MBT domain-containing protein 1-like isoform X2 [Hetaerina americana]|uniref:MBT domain-containing protein 1-like isoform X2 n=1 Tax=Hetaerina americana TaxID=62018 RepID=UPI003A7F61B8
MDMATRDDLGLVWIGDDLLQSDTNEMMLNQLNPQAGSHFFFDSPAMEEMRPRDHLDVDSYMMLDDYVSYDEPPVKYMTSAATQTVQPSKKIKPVEHPGLKLKTPIAYQRDSDLSVIPIQKDGMAVCEKCGAMGVRHAFYTKERRFCSLACARGDSESGKAEIPVQKTAVVPKVEQNGPKSPPSPVVVKKEESPVTSVPVAETPVVTTRARRKTSVSPYQDLNEEQELSPPLGKRGRSSELANTYEWKSQLSESGFIAAPVSCFKHAPSSDCWDSIIVGMKVEVENTDGDEFSESFPDSFWVATVLKISGYQVLLRYEGFGQNDSKDFWVSLCSSTVHPVGWCAERGKPLIPPKTIHDKYKDWKEFLVKRLTGARTLPSNIYSKWHESLKSRFRCGINLEVVDKNRISHVKVATVRKIIGKRLHVKYFDSAPDDNGFWCHEDSPLIHPVGWAQVVGHRISAPPEYLERCEKHQYDSDDAKVDLFPTHPPIPYPVATGGGFVEGMKLEAIDPLNLSAICAATVMKVLQEGYIMIRIDSYDADANGSDWFCYHSTSPCIFPVGFCERNSIALTPPKGYAAGDFDWESYMKESNAIPAPVSLFNRDVPVHGFREGMRLEAADLMDPRLVCVGTVSRVVGRLLKVHFDGWEEEYDQWLDCESPDVYPVGWCQLVGHRLEGPRNTNCTASSAKKMKKKPRRRHKKAKGAAPHLKRKSPISGPVRLNDRFHHEPAQATKLTSEDHSVGAEAIPEGNGLPSMEPEMGQEPAGPDQSLPVASEPSPPTSLPELPRERTATSYINSTSPSGKFIPRLVDSTGLSETGTLVPNEWNVFDVAQFLRVNDCATYCDCFSRQKVDGKTLLSLTEDQVMEITGKIVGPSLKIYNLIKQLKMKVNPAQQRLKASFKKHL